MNEIGIYAVEVNIYFSIFAAALIVFFKGDTNYFLKRWYILFMVVCSILFPFYQFTTAVSSSNFVINLQPIMVSGKAIISNTPVGKNFPSLLAYIYFTGLLISLLKFTIDFYKLRKLISTSEVVFTKNGKIRENQSLASPISFFNIVVWPKNISKQEREFMLAHEQVHISDKHSIDILLIRVFQAFSWFNPFVYAVRNELEATHEFIADKKVTYSFNDSYNYSKLILSRALNTSSTILWHPFFSNSKLLKRRIMMLNKSQPTKMSKLKYFAIIPLLALGFVINACTDDSTVRPTDIKKDNLEKIELSSKEKEALSQPQLVDDMTVYNIADVMPSFPGGDQELMNFLSENIKYPDDCKAEGIEGMVFLSFIIDTEGNMQNVKVLRSPDERLSESAVNTLEQMPQWIPGIKDGSTVNVQFNLPIKYALD